MALSHGFYAGCALTAGALAPLLYALRSDRPRLAAVSKPLASLGFLVAAVSAGALGSGYGALVFAGLVLGLVGDVALLSRGALGFLAGLAAFLLGHLAYVAAFALRGFEARPAVGLALFLSLPAAVVWRWLEPHLPAGMRRPVIAYVAVITAMLTFAGATHLHQPSWALVVGAVCFYLSDLSVARDRFMNAGFTNKLWGLPLYYFAQLALAATTATSR